MKNFRRRISRLRGDVEGDGASQTTARDSALTYDDRVANEIAIFDHFDRVNWREMPKSFGYVGGLKGGLNQESFGEPGFKKFFASVIRRHVDTNGSARIASIGSGNCQKDIDLCKRVGRPDKLVVDCYDLNPELLSQGQEAAADVGLDFRPCVADLNEIEFREDYDIFLAIQSLHHVVNLEELFASIRTAGRPGYSFLINDMIGRNGHMSWPRAQQLLESLWPSLPDRLKWNAIESQLDVMIPNPDQSSKGFEGIRAQDILPLLALDFSFEVFVPFYSFVNRIIERFYGHNYNVDDTEPDDRPLLDHLYYLDELLLRQRYLPPTQAFMVVGEGDDNTGLRSWYGSPEEACYWNFLDDFAEVGLDPVEVAALRDAVRGRCMN